MKIGSTVRHFDVISSTSDAASAAVREGVAEDGEVFTASHQTAGRGRRGTTWTDQPAESILMTVVLYPPGTIESAWKFGWIACLAVIDTVRSLGLNAKCKWPNDVLIDGRKTAGILVETVSVAEGRYAALVGIGVNVKQSKFGDDSEYRLPPTSLTRELNGPSPALDVLTQQICLRLDSLYQPDFGNWDSLASIYRSCVLLGDRQSGLDPETGLAVSGELVDIRDTDGAALLRTADNRFIYAFPENGT